MSSDGKRLYYVGIIDILTRWTSAKRLEHDFKTMKTRNGAGISCVHPSVYSSINYFNIDFNIDFTIDFNIDGSLMVMSMIVFMPLYVE